MSVVRSFRTWSNRSRGFARALLLALVSSGGMSAASAVAVETRSLSLPEVVQRSTHILIVRPPRAPAAATTKIKERIRARGRASATDGQVPPFIYWQSHFVVDRQIYPDPTAGDDLRAHPITVFPPDLDARRAYHRSYYLGRSRPSFVQEHYRRAPAADPEGPRVVFLTRTKGRAGARFAYSVLDAFDSIERLPEIEALLTAARVDEAGHTP